MGEHVGEETARGESRCTGIGNMFTHLLGRFNRCPPHGQATAHAEGIPRIVANQPATDTNYGTAKMQVSTFHNSACWSSSSCETKPWHWSSATVVRT